MIETRFAGSTDVLAPTNDVYNASSNVGRISENGVSITGPNYVIAATMNFNNNLRQLPAVGILGAADIGSGEFNVTGQLNTYFGNKDLAQKVIDNTQTSFDIVFTNGSNGVTMLIDLPQMKYSGGAPGVPGKNADVTVPLDFQAFRHPTLGYTAQVQRFFETA
jgi:hypothetical protein